MSRTDNRLTLSLLLGGGVAALLLLLIIIRAGGAAPYSLISIVVLTLIITAVVAFFARENRVNPAGRRTAASRRDMRALIDEVVDDISADEARFLWRKVNAADRQDLADSIADALENRDDDQQQTAQR